MMDIYLEGALKITSQSTILIVDLLLDAPHNITNMIRIMRVGIEDVHSCWAIEFLAKFIQVYRIVRIGENAIDTDLNTSLL